MRLLTVLVVLTSSLASACSSPRFDRSALPFSQYGAMREVLHDGQSAPRVSVCEASRGHATYGVGALAGLAGEITIDAGQVWVTRSENGVPRTTGPTCVASDQATLLSVGPIEKPATILLTESLGGESLEAAIARAAGVPEGVYAPFLFVIDGTATAWKGHVIAGSCPHADPTSDALQFAITEPVAVRVVGLHAFGAAGTLTHQGSNVHMHVIFERDGTRVTAHADAITLAPGATLTVPTWD